MGYLAVVKQPVSEKENSEFKLAVPCLKIDLVSDPAHGERVNTYE